MDSTPRPTAKRAGLSKEIIAAKALALSEQHGIDGWTVRSIAAELDIVPSVIYHYFPRKDDLCDAVVEEVCKTITLPDQQLEWKEWFLELLLAARQPLLQYHGITERLMRGKFTQAFIPIIDIACEKLQRAGFGQLTALAYSIIFNTAISAIQGRNLRSPKQHNQRHDMREMLARIHPMMQDSPGLQLMVTQLFEPLTRPSQGDSISAEYYELIVRAVIDGAEHVLLPISSTKTSDVD